jgi:hypothetical protein
MGDIAHIGPELGLLIAGAVIIIVDALLPLAGKRAWNARHAISVVLALLGVLRPGLRRHDLDR